MPRITKIYTRTGDDGTTALGTKTRVAKDHPRITTYGTVDELNAIIGVALAAGLSPRLAETLPAIQNELFHLGSDLAFPDEAEKKQFQVPRIEQRHIDAIEALIDELNDVVGPLDNFILPGGCSSAAHLQHARTVCRRAERHLMTLMRDETVNLLDLNYLNRLSDLLFMMGRYENHQRGVEESLWDSHA